MECQAANTYSNHKFSLHELLSYTFIILQYLTNPLIPATSERGKPRKF